MSLWIGRGGRYLQPNHQQLNAYIGKITSKRSNDFAGKKLKEISFTVFMDNLSETMS